jgi:hypothetical protein
MVYFRGSFRHDTPEGITRSPSESCRFGSTVKYAVPKDAYFWGCLGLVLTPHSGLLLLELTSTLPRLSDILPVPLQAPCRDMGERILSLTDIGRMAADQPNWWRFSAQRLVRLEMSTQ